MVLSSAVFGQYSRVQCSGGQYSDGQGSGGQYNDSQDNVGQYNVTSAMVASTASAVGGQYSAVLNSGVWPVQWWPASVTKDYV